MKDRIKELVVESGNGQFHKGKFYPHIGSRTAKDWEKFAELIIRECSDVVNYYHSRNEPITSRQILQHFGVEE